MALLMAFALWILFSYAFAYLLPVVLEGLGWALAFTLYWTGQGIAYAARTLWQLACRSVPHIQSGALLLLFLIRETLSPTPDEDLEEESDEADEPEDTEDTLSDYEYACVRLGLTEPFTEQEFTKAFRRAIATAHPDRGGSAVQARMVYMARAIVATRHGWRH